MPMTPGAAADHQPLRCHDRRRSPSIGQRGLLLGMVIVTSWGSVHQALAEEAAADTPLETILVTATRRPTELDKVPVNVTVYTQDQMDLLSIKQIDDIARLTPDVNFVRTNGSLGASNTSISIRGISSTVGAATTGIYIDDVPIQVRALGPWSGNAYPQVFDLQRVEVLRGPQGTLFGAGAEGGAVRFITPDPSLDKFSGNTRVELAFTKDGSPTYEAGAAAGGPLVSDVLGIRASLWERYDGGYIDRVSPDDGSEVQKDANSQKSIAGKLAATWAPLPNLKITPAAYYQSVHDYDRDEFWEGISVGSDLKNGSRAAQPSNDRFFLPSLKIEDDLDGVSIISNTSAFIRKQTLNADFTNYTDNIFYGSALVFLPGDVPTIDYVQTNQNNVTEEVRLQSNHDSSAFQWTVGGFFTNNRQKASSLNANGQAIVTGPPQILGPLVDGKYGLVQVGDSTDREIAGFANLDYKLTNKVTLTAGVRVSSDDFRYTEDDNGPINGGPTDNSGHERDTPVTPKFGASFQLDANNFLYAAATKGFRPGGAQAPVPADFCATDLATLGLAQSPEAYKSDSVWSYEIGAKDSLLDGTLQLDSSVYWINWDNIQQLVQLPHCGFQYVDNLGSARSRGIDVSARQQIISGMSVGANLGYNDKTYGKTVLDGDSAVLVKSGDAVGVAPPFVGTLFADYYVPVFDTRVAFFHIDGTYDSRGPSPDPALFTYDPALRGTPANYYISMRAGIIMGATKLSLFVNNVSNNHALLYSSHDGIGTPVFYGTTYRPMTAGITWTFKF